MVRRRSARGFTLMELMVTVAIIGIMMGITLTAIQGMRPRMQGSSAAAEVANVLAAARHVAISNSTMVWVGWIPPTADEEARVLVYEDWNGNFDPSQNALFPTPFERDNLDTAAHDDREQSGCGAAGQASCRRDQLQQIIVLPPRVAMVDTAKFGDDSASRVPGPLQWWSPTAFSSLATTGCTFCDGNPRGSGWLAFQPDGEVRVFGDADARGAALTFASDETEANLHLITITAPFGLSGSFMND